MQKYKRKQLKGIDQLNQEQDRINMACRKMEKDWIQNVLSPQRLAFNAASGLISRISGSKKKGKPEKTNPLMHSVKSVLQNKTLQRLALLSGKSWLRWQAFNLAVFLGKKAYQAIRERNRNKPTPSKQERSVTKKSRRSSLLKMK